MPEEEDLEKHQKTINIARDARKSLKKRIVSIKALFGRKQKCFFKDHWTFTKDQNNDPINEDRKRCMA